MRNIWKACFATILLLVSACSENSTPSPSTSSAASVVLDIRSDTAIVQVGDKVSLSSVEVNDGVSISDYKWSFSDGQTLAGKDVSTSFTVAGVVTVKLEAIAGGKSVATAETQVSVVDANALAPAILGLPATLGDVDNDKALKLNDVLFVGQATEGLATLDSAQANAADINRDGRVDAQDVALMQKAVLRNESLPRALLETSARPGAVVAIVSPDLLTTTAAVDIRVDGRESPQILRAVRGYASFVVPDGIASGAKPASVEVLIDGTVKDRLDLTILDPVTLPTDARADVLQLFADIETSINAQQTALRAEASTTGLTDPDSTILLAAGTAGLRDLQDIRTQFVTLLDGTDGPTIAKAFQEALYANGLSEIRSDGLKALAAARALNTVPDPLCDEVIPAICKLKKSADVLGTVSQSVSAACSVLAGTIFVGSLATKKLQIVPVAAKLFVNVCLRLDTTLALTAAISDIFEPIEPRLRLRADKTTLAQGESAIVRTEITFSGTEELCGLGVTQSNKFITDRLGKKVVTRLLTHSVALKALGSVFALLGEGPFAALLKYINEGVTNVIDGTQLSGTIAKLAAKVCPSIGFGAAQAVAANIIQQPKIDEGNLFFKSDGTAEYSCPPPGPVFKSKIDLIGTKQLCSNPPATAKITMTCATSPVTITMGDNGSALDDIFEVVIGGRTVLTSNGPTRSISTTIQLPKGRTEVIMRGLAAPDGIGTYFISFSGAAVVGGDALSGTDLVPGTSKRFTIEVL